MTPRSSPPTTPGEGCEAYAQAAMLQVDRELGRAESIALEAHLAVCPACRQRARQATALSRLLRAWDAETAGRFEAPARTRTAVLNALAEEDAWRRAEWHQMRVGRLAAAASLLLVLGASVVLGLTHADRRGPGSATTAKRAFEATAPAAVPTAARPADEPHGALRPSLALPPLPASRLAHIVPAATSRPAAWLKKAERDRAFETLAALPDRAEQIYMERICEDRTDRFLSPVDGEERLVTISALAYLRARGFDSVPVYVEHLRQGGRSRTIPASREPEVVKPTITDTGRRVVDYLGLRTSKRALENLLRIPLAELPAGKIRVYAVPSSVREAARPLPRVADLTEGMVGGHVELGEGAGTDLVAVVKGAPHPIFVPAGELIEGGRIDRVVAKGVWIPASPSRVQVNIACFPVGTSGAAKTGSEPMPTGILAPPAVRYLLASGADARSLVTWLHENMPFEGRYDYSVAKRYVPRDLTRILDLEGRIRRAGARGIVLVDERGDLLGIELTDLPAVSAAPLLARAALSYEAEATIENRAIRLHGDRAAWRSEGKPAVYALRDLLAHAPTLLTTDSQASPMRRARTVDVRTRVAVEVAERPEDGATVLVSALASPRQ